MLRIMGPIRPVAFRVSPLVKTWKLASDTREVSRCRAGLNPNPCWHLSEAEERRVESKRSRRLRKAPAEQSASRLCSSCAPSHPSSRFRQRSRGRQTSRFQRRKRSHLRRRICQRLACRRRKSRFQTAAQQAARSHCHDHRRQCCDGGSAAVDDRQATCSPRGRHAPPFHSTC